MSHIGDADIIAATQAAAKSDESQSAPWPAFFMPPLYDHPRRRIIALN
jgi:hypothetical protein